MSDATRGRSAVGKVVSNKMDKSIVIMVQRKVRHPKYHKYITRSTKLHAHDEQNQCQIGDLVKVNESRPISKTKTWNLVEILETNK